MMNLDYSKLSKGVITPSYLVDGKEYRSVNVTAPDNFVSDVMFPILNTLSATSAPYVYSAYIGNIKMSPKAKSEKCSVTYLRKGRHYAAAFNLFSTFGISLSGLMLVYSSESKTLYVPKKVHQFITKLDAEAQNMYVMYLLYCHRFLIALTKANGSWTEVEVIGNPSPTFQLSEDDLRTITAGIQPASDSEEVNLGVISEDFTLSSLVYIKSPKGSRLPLLLSTATFPANGLVYNVLEAEGKHFLAIVNKMFKPEAYYIIDPSKRAIVTNMELMSFNTMSDGSEFIPQLVQMCMDAFAVNEPTSFGVCSLPAEKMLDAVIKAKEFEFVSDTYGFDAILDGIPGIMENYDAKLYDQVHSKDLTMKSSSISASMASEYESDEYAKALYAQNQDYYESYDLGNLTNVVRGIAAKGPDQVYSMLFEGETGTGKSTAARVMFFKAGLPWISINCSTNIDEADIFGSMIPNPMKKDASDPEFIWQDGPATKAIRFGYGLIVEEGNGARPGVLLKFNSLLDEARQIELGNGEVLKAHPNFRLIFTSNIAYEGTNVLNKAFVDRFNVVHKFADLDKTSAINVVKARTGYTDATKIEKVYGVYAAVKKYSEEQNLGLAVSIRRLMDVFTKGKYYKNALIAVQDILLDHAFLQEPEHLEYFSKTVLPSFDLAFKI